jgi:hypothetical protein
VTDEEIETMMIANPIAWLTGTREVSGARAAPGVLEERI